MKKGGQIWIETVIYTLIAFVMIGLVLAYVKPKIEEIQDKAIIEQSINILEEINSIILSLVQGVPGNQRVIEMGIKKGVLSIDAVNEKIIFEIESNYVYSQPGEDIEYGGILVNTETKGNINLITLTSDYREYDLTYKEKDELKSISKSTVPYKLLITNKGGDDKTILNIDLS